MDRPVGVGLDFGVRHVEGVTEHVEEVTLHAVTDGNGNRCAGVDHSLTADQAVGLLQGDGANNRVAQVLSGLEGDGAGAAVEGQLGSQSVVNLGDLTGGELDVDHGADDAGNTTRCALSRCGDRIVVGGSHISHLLRKFGQLMASLAYRY